jgi:Sigma-70 region 2
VSHLVKSVGKPDAGNRHVRFDERGRETGFGTAPFLDSTHESKVGPQPETTNEQPRTTNALSHSLLDRRCSIVNARSEAVNARAQDAAASAMNTVDPDPPRRVVRGSEETVTETPFDFEATFRAQYERIARVIARVVQDPARAEELAVEVFLKLWRNPQAQGENAGGWLYRTAVRKGLDELRRRTRRTPL